MPAYYHAKLLKFVKRQRMFEFVLSEEFGAVEEFQSYCSEYTGRINKMSTVRVYKMSFNDLETYLQVFVGGSTERGRSRRP